MSTEQTASSHSPRSDISLLELGALLLQHARVIVLATLAGLLIAAAAALLAPDRYTSSASFLPQASSRSLSRAGGLAGVAGQLGLSLPGEGGGDSPEFYAALLRSRQLLGTLASQEFTVAEGAEGPAPGRSGTLAELLDLRPRRGEAGIRREAAIRWLRRRGVAVSTERETGLVSVSVTTPWPELSQAVADRLLELVNHFNLRSRQTQAAAERAFIEARLAEKLDSLRAAEDRLEHFMQTNRRWSESPELTLERERLQREIAMRQAVYVNLADAYEQARIAEVRNTPVITVVETPERPVRADPQRPILTLVLGLFSGAFLGVLFAFLREYAARARTRDEEHYRRLLHAWTRTRADLRSLLRTRRDG